MSINLCTDQMAMLVAGEGQLISVSMLAADPAVSMMAEEAAGYRLNDGLAEQVFLMRPDLVLAGSYSTRATVDLLKRLGIAVSEFQPAASLDDVRHNLERLGVLLDRKPAADELIAGMDAGLAALAETPPGKRTAALYYANGYTSGKDSLAGDMLARLGLVNIASEAGVDTLGRLPLERLIMAAPDVIVGGDVDYDAPALAQAGFTHPAFVAATGHSDYVNLPSRYSICGGPFNVAGIALLAEALGGGGADE
ncbi:ABC transporter substrate-binding protein [Martelella soudanensis]|uniref:ABC transporter substrate-binding protein n=1 Tax=unclassified Martelella TaxID=2629616 RepID=UPI0015DFD89C|nr:MULTISPECIES: ABC transporter substrate-binding protein [unclassified Martelella]